MKVIITGSTGMVGEGVLFECLENPKVTGVLMINRRSYSMQHIKLKELIIADFMKLESYDSNLSGYDACFYCAGISSVGMNEEKYTKITYDTTIYFAQKLLTLNPGMVFNFVSGSHTDSSEKGKLMWARVKGKTENALMKLGFRASYNFRPGFMKPFANQKNVNRIFKIFGLFFTTFFQKKSLSLKQVGQAMISVVITGYPKEILEIADIKKSAKD